jgi:membrane-associated phospholipid phosphatase
MPPSWSGLALSACLILFGAHSAGAQVLLPASQDPVVAVPEATAPSGDMPGISRLFSPLGRDFRALASRRNLLLAGIGLATSTGAHPFDGSLAQARWGGAETAPMFAPGKTVGAFAVQAGGALATYAVGRVAHNPNIATLGSEIFRAQVVAQLTAQAVKLSTNRTRPDGTTLSFPSGHTAAGFATASVLQAKYGWKAAIPAYTVATWIAASRMQSKRHYLSDVIAGATIGIMAGRSVTVGKGHNTFSVAPMAVAGGVGVSLVRVGSRSN